MELWFPYAHWERVIEAQFRASGALRTLFQPEMVCNNVEEDFSTYQICYLRLNLVGRPPLKLLRINRIAVCGQAGPRSECPFLARRLHISAVSFNGGSLSASRELL